MAGWVTPSSGRNSLSTTHPRAHTQVADRLLCAGVGLPRRPVRGSEALPHDGARFLCCAPHLPEHQRRQDVPHHRELLQAREHAPAAPQREVHRHIRQGQLCEPGAARLPVELQHRLVGLDEFQPQGGAELGCVQGCGVGVVWRFGVVGVLGCWVSGSGGGAAAHACPSSLLGCAQAEGSAGRNECLVGRDTAQHSCLGNAEGGGRIGGAPLGRRATPGPAQRRASIRPATRSEESVFASPGVPAGLQGVPQQLDINLLGVTVCSYGLSCHHAWCS